VTEGGYDSAMMGGPERQAIIDVQKVAAAPAGGIDGYFVFTLCDLDAVRTQGVASHFGLVDADFHPKPAFSSYQRLIAELGDRRYRAPPEPRPADDPLWALLYAGADAHRVVMWRNGRSDGIPFLIQPDPGAHLGNVRDMMGNPQSVIRLADGGVVAGIRDAPSYLSMTGAPRYPRLAPLITLDLQPVVVPGREAPIAFTLHNPLDVPLALSLEAEVDAVIDFAPRVISAVLEPGASRTIQGMLRVVAYAASRETLRLRLRCDAGEGSMEISTAVDVALPIPGADTEEPLVLALDSADQVRPLRALPGPEWQWGGPADLSARIVPVCGPRGLTLTVRVTDQKHHAEDATPLWQHDSIQVGLARDVDASGFLELGVGMHEDGSTRARVYRSPDGYAAARGDPARSGIEAAAAPDGEGATYRVMIPWKALGLTAPPDAPFRLNVLVNDDDGLGRKQWIHMSPGIGNAKDSRFFRVFNCHAGGRRTDTARPD
ncbi:MAG: hypothetical protein JXB13_12305, partial [Phycisphaerae bacterium]|nr:hypothetical protein [Phycisphaerae bacterium]